MKKSAQLGMVLAVVSVFLPLASAKAQEANTKSSQRTATAQDPSTGALISDKAQDNIAFDQIQELRKQVQQLRELVEQQQQSLLKLEQRLDGGVRTSAASDGPAFQKVAGNVAPSSQSVRDEATDATPAVTQPDPKAQRPAPLLAGWNGSHAFLRSADGNFETDITGYAQLDFRAYQRGNHPPNTFLIRRARLALEGKVMRYFDFKIEGDFADTTSTLLRDFYVRFHRTNSLQLTFGQFRLPYSQEELRRDANQDFVERSLVNNLAPSRNPGLMVSGVLLKGLFEYQVGAFNGKGILVNNTVGTPEGTVRLRFAPWKNTKSFWTKGLAFGGTYSLGRSAINGTSIRGLTESRSFTFFAPETVNGPIIRANGEITWTIGPAAFRGEYDQTNQFRNRLGVGGTNLPGVVAKGYMGQFTYLLTGEDKTESDSVAPKHPFFADEKGARGFGAWELKARYASLQIDDRSPKSNRAQTIYFGANWYLNNFVRYVLDLGFERYRNPLFSPKPGDRNFFVILSRIQVAW
jgi:phosphate-selective porin OprO and OprP